MSEKSKKESKGKERRRASRIDTWLNASFQAADSQWRTGFIRDISDTGAHIITLEPLAPGEKTAILLESINELENVMVLGKVIWKVQEDPANKDEWDAPSMGVEFEEALPVTSTCFIQSDNGQKGLT